MSASCSIGGMTKDGMAELERNQADNSHDTQNEQTGNAWTSILKTIVCYVVLTVFPNDILSLKVFVTNSPNLEFYARGSTLIEQPVWSVDGIVYDNGDDGILHKHINITLTPEQAQEGHLFLHAFIHEQRYITNQGKQSSSTPDRIVSVHNALVTLKPREELEKTRHLLDGGTPSTDQDYKEDATSKPHSTCTADFETCHADNQLVPYWYPSASLELLTEHSPLTKSHLQGPLQEKIQLDHQTSKYIPPLYYNDFWIFAEDLTEINASTHVLPLNITFSRISLFKLNFLLSMSSSLQQQVSLGLVSQSQQDQMKKMFLDTNPYYLGVTILVSLLHTVFDWLAFKNDIQFWRKQKSVKGLSTRGILSCWDGNPGLEIIADAYIQRFFPTEMAFRYLSWFFIPVFFAYAVYSLLHNEHKGWYSYTINMLAGAVYTFGFIRMTPQLFINYKLKSVGHMPWRVMVYKFLNTIIDDLFAFIIPMPTLHRLSCFRDDIIFLLFLYQRWIYRVDNKRGYETESADQQETYG
eukprot:gene5762-9015_t